MDKDIFNVGLSKRAVNVYLYLKYRANADGQCWPSARRIAEDLGVSQRTVYRAVDELRKAGVIETRHRVRKSGAWSSLMYKV